MEVYWEYAFAENFLLDGLLLYLALRAARGRVRWWNLLLAAAVGGAEAVVFPLFSLPTFAAYAVKLFGGLLLAVLAVSKGTKKTYLVTIAMFFALTFALGGLITAAYSFFRVEYAEGTGYLVEKAPVGLIVALAGIFAVLVTVGIKRGYRYQKLKRNLFPCIVEVNGKKAEWTGLADSGNLLLFRGEPVCVISAITALALFKGREPVGRMTVGTVNGGTEKPVFVCDGLRVNGHDFGSCYFTVGDINTKEYRVILHTAFVEGINETDRLIKGMAAKNSGK